MAQTDHGGALGAERLCLLDGMPGVHLSAAVEGHRAALGDEGYLYRLVRAGSLWGSRALLARGAPEAVAAGHPARRRQFAEHDAVEVALAVIEGEHAPPALLQVGRRDPRHQRLVRDPHGVSSPQVVIVMVILFVILIDGPAGIDQDHEQDHDHDRRASRAPTPLPGVSLGWRRRAAYRGEGSTGRRLAPVGRTHPRWRRTTPAKRCASRPGRGRIPQRRTDAGAGGGGVGRPACRGRLRPALRQEREGVVPPRPAEAGTAP